MTRGNHKGIFGGDGLLVIDFEVGVGRKEREGEEAVGVSHSIKPPWAAGV